MFRRDLVSRRRRRDVAGLQGSALKAPSFGEISRPRVGFGFAGIDGYEHATINPFQFGIWGEPIS